MANMETVNMNQLGYVQARKEFTGYALFWRGTLNEIFQGERFASAALARSYFKAMAIKAQADNARSLEVAR